MSFATEDRRAAESAVDALESNGYKCWVAWRDIPESVPYAAAIVQGIRGARLLLVLLTPESRSSPHVLREVEAAVAANRPILSVQVAGCLPGEALAYYLGPTQWLRNDQTELDVDSVVEAVSKLLKDARSVTKAVAGSRPWRALFRSARRFPVGILLVTGLALLILTGVFALFLQDPPHGFGEEETIVVQIHVVQHRCIVLVLMGCFLLAGLVLEDALERRRAPYNPLRGRFVPSYAIVVGLFLLFGLGVWSLGTGLSPVYLVTGSSPGLNDSVGIGIPHFLTGFGGESSFWLKIKTVFSPKPYGWDDELAALIVLLATAMVLSSIALCMTKLVRSSALALTIVVMLPFLLVRWWTTDVGVDHGLALIYRASPVCAALLSLWLHSIVRSRRA